MNVPVLLHGFATGALLVAACFSIIAAFTLSPVAILLAVYFGATGIAMFINGARQIVARK